MSDATSSGGDYGLKEANAFKKTKKSRGDVKAAYKAQPLKQRKVAAHSKAPGEAAKAVRHEHKSRVERNRSLDKAQAKHDVPTDRDLHVAALAENFLKHHGAEHADDNTVEKVVGFLGKAVDTARDSISRSSPTAIDSYTKGGKSSLDIPSSYIKLAKDPIGSVKNDPIGTALLLSPGIGKVGKLAAKSTKSLPKLSTELAKRPSTDVATKTKYEMGPVAEARYKAGMPESWARSLTVAEYDLATAAFKEEDLSAKAAKLAVHKAITRQNRTGEELFDIIADMRTEYPAIEKEARKRARQDAVRMLKG